MSWKFSSVNLVVLRTPEPVWSIGQRQIVFIPPGYDGAVDTIPDGRPPTTVIVTVVARDPVELAMLSALFSSGLKGNLEIPVSTDHLVYEDAVVNNEPQWRQVQRGTWYETSVEFLCPNPRPTWKTSGEQAF